MSTQPTWPEDPDGDMTPILDASIEAAKGRHPSGKDIGTGAHEAIEREAAEEAPLLVLTGADRCDGCGVGAAYKVARARNGVDRELSFCGHDYRQNSLALTRDGWSVVAINPELIPK